MFMRRMLQIFLWVVMIGALDERIDGLMNEKNVYKQTGSYNIDNITQDYVAIQFQITTPSMILSYILLVAEFGDKITNNYTKKDFLRKQPTDYYNLDLYALQTGQKQIVNLFHSDEKYLTYGLINLNDVDQEFKMNYTITIKSVNSKQCRVCKNGEMKQCFCNCNQNFYGSDCNRRVYRLEDNKNEQIPFVGPTYKYLLLENVKNMELQLKLQGASGKFYYLSVDDPYQQFASYTNKMASIKDQTLKNGSARNFTYNSKTQSFAFTIQISQEKKGTLYAQYSEKESSESLNLTQILLGVLGALLVIGILVAVCYFCKRRNTSHAIGPQIQEFNKLSNDEINKYFPVVLYSDVRLVSQAEASAINLQSKQTTVDCVICLCPVQDNQQIRVTYCKHIFHQKCIFSWFRKQRNCPYCRQQFTKQNTIDVYKQLVAFKGNQVLRDIQLVRAILERSRFKSVTKVSDLEGQNHD